MGDPLPGADPSTTAAADDRAAAFATRPPGVPAKAIVIALALVAVLGLGGAALDHVFTGPSGSAGGATGTGDYPPPFAAPPTAAGGQSAGVHSLSSSIPALMGLTSVSPEPAPAFALADQHGTTISPASLRGSVVVLTFFDGTCDDICPVLSAELTRAHADLGADASRVAFVTVNTDPLALSPASAAPARAAGFGRIPTWHFVTGTLEALDAVWTAYGVQVDVQRVTGLVSHNDVMYFVDPSGHLRYRATPFADESGSGRFTLAPATEVEWAGGIASEARSLIAGTP